MNEKIKTAGVIAVSASAVVASSVYAYTNIIKDNKVEKEDPKPTATVVPTSTNTATSTPSTSVSKYKDGQYVVSGDYDTNNDTIHHKMQVTITLDDDKITAATTELKDDPLNSSAVSSNKKFSDALKTAVVGKTLDEVADVGRISGSSDTTTGFKAAVEKVKIEAQSY